VEIIVKMEEEEEMEDETNMVDCGDSETSFKEESSLSVKAEVDPLTVVEVDMKNEEPSESQQANENFSNTNVPFGGIFEWQKQKSYSCDKCEYVTNRLHNLNHHKRAKHKGVSYPCDKCGYVATLKADLKKHREAKHDRVRYPCNQCSYAATRKGYLKKHKKAKHEGLRYHEYGGVLMKEEPIEKEETTETFIILPEEEVLDPNKERSYSCDKCEYVTTRLHNLNHHKRARHRGIYYPCDECEYVATLKADLKKHKEAKHEGVRYPCDQCSYASTRKAYLKKHKEFKHEGSKFLCDQCSYYAKTAILLDRHKKSRHDIKCDICLKRFSNRRCLNYHDRTHHNVAPQ